MNAEKKPLQDERVRESSSEDVRDALSCGTRSTNALSCDGHDAYVLPSSALSCGEVDIGAWSVPSLPAHPREKIVALCKHNTNRALHKGELLAYEYWSFATAATDEMADVLLKLKIRKPYTLDDAVRVTGVETTHLEELLDEMSYIGLLEYNWENPTHTKQWIQPILVPGSAEFLNMRRHQVEEHPMYAKFFEQASKGPLSRVAPMVPPGGAGIGMHVIPVERAIHAEQQSLPIEHISHWLNKYKGQLAKSMCSCRISREVLGEGCGDDPDSWCIAVGDMADYIVETNRGIYIDREEALDIFRRAEELGYVHQITNIDGENKIFAICNCNVNVCYALRTSQLFNTPNLSRSAYVARVNPKNCVACGGCVEVCPAGAVKLGQKLCLASTGNPPAYPKQDLPDAMRWGPYKWNPDYRDKARTESYDLGTAPCKVACPAHIAVQGYLKLAAQGRFTEALALIKRENPLPAVCGRICNRACEDACTRGRLDGALAIDEVKKYIAQLDLDSETRFIPPKRVPRVDGEFDEKIAIIGAGPAGLSCAFYLAEKGYHPTVFERHALPGGMLTYGVPSFKLEKKVIQAEVDVIAAMGVDFRYSTEVGRDISLEELRKQGFKAFYVAIGCQGGRRAGLCGEDAQGVEAAVEFLHSVAEGTRASMPARVVVVGGGNVAVDVARSARRLGAKQVDMVCLERRLEMPATPEEIREAEEDGVSVHCGWGPLELHTHAADSAAFGPTASDEAAVVDAITFKRCTSTYDKHHRFDPVYDEQDTFTCKADLVVMCIGQTAQWGGLLAGTQVELVDGRVQADPVTYQTAEPDIFVGGDVYTGPKFAIDAIAAGHEAAVSIHRYVRGGTLTIGRNKRHYVELNKDDVDVGSYDTTPRQEPLRAPDLGRETAPLSEYVGTLTEEQVRLETSRCLSCGASIVDENKCIGCGVCTTQCDFDAIHLYRERPECSTMIRCEDKLPAIGAYALKRAIKIKFAGKQR